jgi:hypothetical protein
MTILISDKLESKSKPVIRDKEECYIIIKTLDHHEDKTIINIYAPKISVPKCMKQTLTKLRKKQHTVIV